MKETHRRREDHTLARLKIAITHELVVSKVSCQLAMRRKNQLLAIRKAKQSMNKIASKVKLEVKKARVTRKCSSREEDHRELQKSQRKTNKNTKLYTNLSLFSDQFLLAGPDAVFIGPERTLQKTNRWQKSGTQRPRFCGNLAGNCGTFVAVGSQIFVTSLLRGCYPRGLLEF